VLIKHRRNGLKTEKRSENSGNKLGLILNRYLDQDIIMDADYIRFLFVRFRVINDVADETSNFYQRASFKYNTAFKSHIYILKNLKAQNEEL